MVSAGGGSGLVLTVVGEDSADLLPPALPPGEVEVDMVSYPMQYVDQVTYSTDQIKGITRLRFH